MMGRAGVARLAVRGLLCTAVLAVRAAGAHSASDAYLTFSAEPHGDGELLHGQWDIALRDLDFVLALDRGTGQLTWGEVRRRQADIERYAYRHLHVLGDGRECRIEPQRQWIDEHADGAYAALFFDVECASRRKLTLDYSLFFDIDPSHRGIFVMRQTQDVATSVLSPRNARVPLPLE
jgi:hypothetical protein